MLWNENGVGKPQNITGRFPIQTRIASDGGTTSGTHTVGQPLFRHALLEEAKERQWKPAYSN